MMWDVELIKILNASARAHPLWRMLAIGSATGLVWLMGFPTVWVAWRKRAVLLLLLSMLLVFGVNYGIAAVAFRPRPREGIVRLIAEPHSLKSFPSDHAAIAAAFAATVFLFFPRAGIAMGALALLVGLGRVAVGVHYPSDIAGGLVVGVAAVALARFMLR